MRTHARFIRVLYTLIFAFSISAFAETATQTSSYNLPPGPLGRNLSTIATQNGIPLSFDPRLTEGLQSPALKGEYTPIQALDALLNNSRLMLVQQNDGSYTLEKATNTVPMQLEPIMVIGELQTRTLQDTQTSVAVISGDRLERRYDADLVDIAERTANVSTTGPGRNFVIRGIPEGGVSNAIDVRKTITTTVDGASISNFFRSNAAFFSTWDLEQVEILRGPQSTQSGRNSLAGAVIVRSKDPSYEREIKIRGGIGNAETYEGAAAFNLPIVDDKLAFRLSVDADTTNGFTSNPTRGIDDQNAKERTTVRGGLRIDPTENLSAVLKLTHFQTSDSVFGILDRSSFPDRVLFTNVDDFSDSDIQTANLRLRYKISDSFRIESETTYLHEKNDQLRDWDGTAAALLRFDIDIDSESIAQEFRLHYESENANGVVGFYYTDISEDTNGDLIDESTNDLLLSFGNDSETENYAIFGEVEYRVLPKLRVIAGGRYDREKFELENKTFSVFLPKVGVIYDFTDDVSLGFTYQEGYRAGGAFLNGTTFELVPYDPEFTQNYELAFRSQWHDQRITLNANLFYTDWKDQQTREEVFPGPATIIVNAGSSQLYGGEIELSAQITDNLEAFGSVGFVDTEFKDFIFNGMQLAGNEFPNAAGITGAFGADYFFANGFYISGDASFTEGAFTDIQNTESRRNDTRFLVNLRVGYEAEDWGVFVYSDNLFNKEYLTGSDSAGDPRRSGVIFTANF